jgi:universal stress protein A
MIDKSITENASQLNDVKLSENTGRVRRPIGLRRILAPTDLTPDGRKAVEYAIALAEHFNSQLTLLHVYAAPNAKDYSREINDYSVVEIARAALDSVWLEFREEYPRIDAQLRCGEAAEQIVAAAKDLDVDLIVVSTHNYSWFTHCMHGSDAEEVLRHAPCPILVVRKDEKDFVGAD